MLSRDEIDPDTLVPQWDSKGTSLVLKKATSKGAMPSGPEQLRLRLTVMQNALLMMGLQHPERTELKDIDFQLLKSSTRTISALRFLLRAKVQRG